MWYFYIPYHRIWRSWKKVRRKMCFICLPSIFACLSEVILIQNSSFPTSGRAAPHHFSFIYFSKLPYKLPISALPNNLSRLLPRKSTGFHRQEAFLWTSSADIFLTIYLKSIVFYWLFPAASGMTTFLGLTVHLACYILLFVFPPPMIHKSWPKMLCSANNIPLQMPVSVFPSFLQFSNSQSHQKQEPTKHY